MESPDEDDRIHAAMIQRPDELARLHKALLAADGRLLILEGAPGSGKTTLLTQFARSYRHAFPGGAELWQGRNQPDLQPQAEPSGDRRLLIYDGLDETLYSIRSVISDLRYRLTLDPQLYVLAASRPLTELESLPLVQLSPWTRAEAAYYFMAVRRTNTPPPDLILDFVEGRPLLARLVGDVLDSTSDWGSVLDTLRASRRIGLVDLRGRPLEESSGPGRALIERVSQIDAALMALIQRDPNLVHHLTPRQFEEVCAELFQRLGFQVELTPPTRDGGKDLIVAKQDELGKVLTFVECKRYSPERPVGVGVVRALYGVVERARATFGIVMTTSHFTRNALREAGDLAFRMSLRDHEAFQGMLDRAMSGRS